MDDKDRIDERLERIKMDKNAILNAIIPNFEALKKDNPCTDLENYIEKFLLERFHMLTPPIHETLGRDKSRYRYDCNMIADKRKAGSIDFDPCRFVRQSLDGPDEPNSSNSAEASSGDKPTAGFKYSARTKKIMAMRVKRRREAEDVVIMNFTCSEDELLKNFDRAYQVLLSIHSSSSTIFYTIVKTLRAYYRTQTWEDLIERYLIEFLIRTLHRNCIWMARYYDMKTEDVDYGKVLVDYETRVLIDMYIFYRLKQNKAIPRHHYSEKEIILKSRFIYVAGAGEYMKRFLDEAVCDTFGHILPFKVAEMYYEECLEMPLDVDERVHGESSRKVVSTLVQPHATRSNRALCRVVEGKEQKHAQEVVSTSNVDDSRTFRDKRTLTTVSEKEMVGTKLYFTGIGQERKKLKTKVKTKKRKRPFPTFSDVPDTPEDKIRKADEVTEERGIVFVPQTPISEMPRECHRLVKRIGPVDEIQAAIWAKETKCGRKSRREAMRRLRGRQKKSVHIQHLSKFENVCSQTSTQSSLVLQSPQKKAIIEIVRRRAVGANKTIGEDVGNDADICIFSPGTQNVSYQIGESTPDEEVVTEYQKRMEATRTIAAESITNEIFYGLHTERQTLFDGFEGLVVEESWESLKSASKNRSGRTVRNNFGEVFVANSLLNVHNRDPMQAYRFPRSSHQVICVPRLLRRPRRPHQKRHLKFCTIIKCEGSGLSTSIIKPLSRKPEEAGDDFTCSETLNCRGDFLAKDKLLLKQNSVHDNVYETCSMRDGPETGKCDELNGIESWKCSKMFRVNL